MSEQTPNSAQRPPPLYPQAPTHGIQSAPSSATLQSPLTPGNAAMPNSEIMSRPSSGPGNLQSQHLSLPPGSNSRSNSYIQSFHSSMASPGGTLPGFQEFGHHGSLTSIPSMAPSSQIMSVGVQGQKRAYRQRRKDPSCDACRERKVKCDATDSSSCTECSSRNVKCQFTKETNRRMSNIRHNQDLQKELAQARSQVNHLRSILDGGKTEASVHDVSTEHLPIPGPSQKHKLSNLPDPVFPHVNNSLEQSSRYEPRENKKRRTTSKLDLSKVGINMQRYGRGIFKPPYPISQNVRPFVLPSALPELPPKQDADTLMRHYRFTLHPTLPMIHWPSFQEKYENVYRDMSFANVPRIWIALLYAVFACGTLHRSWRDGRKYLEISRSIVDLWNEELTLDHARTALLSSIFLVEINLKSAGWTWIGYAVRISYDIGLHCEAGTWSAIEVEMRRRVWWCIYACDCLLSLELGRPALIKEEDCDVELPSAIDDQHMRIGINWISPTAEQSTSPLLPMIKVIGGIAKLLRMLKSRRLTRTTLQAYDTHFITCMQAFPPDKPNREYIDPIDLHPMIYLQNARLMLHRHNLSPTCEADERSAAIDHCVSVSRDTAQLLHRSMQETPMTHAHPSNEIGSWETRMISATSTFLCTHIWRCTLFLCFRFDFASALLCTRASAAMGNTRPINVACGRYLEFFLTELIRKLDQKDQLDTDEEMIAYVSADLQGSFENSWIWQERKEGVQLGRPLQSSDNVGNGEASDPDSAKVKSEAEGSDWAAWDKVVNILEQLYQTGAIQDPSIRPPMVLPPINPSNRMSIRDLI